MLKNFFCSWKFSFLPLAVWHVNLKQLFLVKCSNLANHRSSLENTFKLSPLFSNLEILSCCGIRQLWKMHINWLLGSEKYMYKNLFTDSVRQLHRHPWNLLTLHLRTLALFLIMCCFNNFQLYMDFDEIRQEIENETERISGSNKVGIFL